MESLLDIANKFRIEGTILSIEEYGCGHINLTYLVVTDKKRYIMQAINNKIFTNVDGLMNNVYLVTSHISNKNASKETLSIIKTVDDKIYYFNNEKYFRVYNFVENSVCLQQVSNEKEFYECAKAFGEFANDLSDFDASLLYEVIPDFHNTVKRYENFEKAIINNKANRLDQVKNEIEFVKARKEFCHVIVDRIKDGRIPLRVTHNDTKLNNVLLDDKTFEGKVVIDLDTIMPGSILYDFGDSIRFGCNSSSEDDPNLDNVYFRVDLFEIYVKGYLESLKDSITKEEVNNLVNGAMMMTFECGMRFLCDFLDGDTYFRTSRANQNLDRCHTQFKLVEEMEKNYDSLNKIVLKYAKEYGING